MTTQNEPQPSVNNRGIPIVVSAPTGSPRRHPLTPKRSLASKVDLSRQNTEYKDKMPSSQSRTPTQDKTIVDMHDSFSTACFHSHLKALSNVQEASPVKQYPSQFSSPQRKPIVIKELPKPVEKERPTKEYAMASPIPANISKHALSKAGTPSSQQPTALMATEDEMLDDHQQSHEHEERAIVDPEKTAEQLNKDQRPTNKNANVNVLPAQVLPADSKENAKSSQEQTQPETGTQTVELESHENILKRKRSLEKTAEELLKEEVTEIMDEFTTLGDYYKLVDKIGEGTFSSVYKAIDVRHDYYDNSTWDLSSICKDYERINLEESDLIATSEDANGNDHSTNQKHSNNEPPTQFVALKRIYVTSSPQRITSEIEILHQLKCLLTALKHVHQNRILHRDIKPGNFLYNFRHRTGMLVDFGLAQREDETRPSSPPPTTLSQKQPSNVNSVLRSRQANIPLSLINEKENLRSSNFKEPQTAPTGYYRNDNRNPVRANRAGTRGFRAPEVLLRVVHQTVSIDIWAVGVILLSILTSRFPFFQSEDDADALVEVAGVFGLREVKECASIHNRTFHTNIPNVPKTRISFLKLCLVLNKERAEQWGDENLRLAVDLLEKVLVLDCNRRISAEEALNHPFLSPNNSKI
ncbi:hypothetical protein NQZ79_g7719 [Umbelopsis isabellina]|nr:hypothetical protein NQZ79_g7719 [Umbelopsis isabellina]